ncbi:MAG TPA: hypothetical protein VGA99_09585 [bacterium]
MKAPMSKEVREILSNPKDAKAFAKAVRDHSGKGVDVVVKLPSGRRVRIRRLGFVEQA